MNKDCSKYDTKLRLMTSLKCDDIL